VGEVDGVSSYMVKHAAWSCDDDFSGLYFFDLGGYCDAAVDACGFDFL